MALTGESYIESPLKRTLDRFGGTIIGLGSLPLSLAVGAETCLEHRVKNPLFVQQRLGKMGEAFDMYKFRSIRRHVRTEFAMGGVDHPHATPIGRLIRAAGLDELPQFANVAKGQIGLVGIRPMPEDTMDAYQEAVDDETLFDEWRGCYERYPGLTGEAQLYTKQFGDHNDPELIRRRMEIDIESFHSASFSNELHVLARTPFVALSATVGQVLPQQLAGLPGGLSKS